MLSKDDLPALSGEVRHRRGEEFGGPGTRGMVHRQEVGEVVFAPPNPLPAVPLDVTLDAPASELVPIHPRSLDEGSDLTRGDQVALGQSLRRDFRPLDAGKGVEPCGHMVAGLLCFRPHEKAWRIEVSECRRVCGLSPRRSRSFAPTGGSTFGLRKFSLHTSNILPVTRVAGRSASVRPSNQNHANREQSLRLRRYWASLRFAFTHVRKAEKRSPTVVISAWATCFFLMCSAKCSLAVEYGTSLARPKYLPSFASVNQ